MARAMAHPVAYPMAHPKFCNFTNYKEKTTTYVKKGQALQIRALAAIFFLSNSSPRRPGQEDAVLDPGHRDPLEKGRQR